MDTTDLTLVFPGGATRIFPAPLIVAYPQCSFAIGQRDVTCKEVVVMNDMTVDEYDQLLLVLTNQLPYSQCNERVTTLLDEYGFIGRLDRMLEGPVSHYTRDLMTRLTPFHHRQSNLFICQSTQEYYQCKLALIDPTVIPIQVLTVGNHLVFCSYNQGIPLINWNGEVYLTIGESREASAPIGLPPAIQLIKDSIALCKRVKEGTYQPNIIIPNQCPISKEELVETLIGLLPPNVFGAAGGRNAVYDMIERRILPEHLEVGKRSVIVNRVLTSGGMLGIVLNNFNNFTQAKPKVDTCCYCGDSFSENQCACDEYQVTHWKNLNTLDAVSYINSLFELYFHKLETFTTYGGKYEFDKGQLDLLTRLSDKEETTILKAVCSADWKLATVISTHVTDSKWQVTKLAMHLGFVRI